VTYASARRLTLFLAVSIALGCSEQALGAAPLAGEQRAAVAASFGHAPECIEGRVSTVDASFVTVNMTYAEGCSYDDEAFVGSIVRSQDGGRTYGRVADVPEREFCPVDGVPTPVAIDLGACVEAASLPPVLGELGFYGEHGKGWGRARPRTVYNGGVPSGLVRRIRWSGWGSRVAIGRGMTYLYKPRGGYYARPGRIILRASRLGSCPGTGGRRAYTRLSARAQVRPGGRYGRWFRWGGNPDICGSFLDR